jgi:ABC-type multidrug transport system ATPase subunit
MSLINQDSDRPTALTGGQKKRVSIGLGLVGNPKVLFLDEPTTGLDSTAALNIVDYIITVARKMQVICIMTIHQPAASVFDALDDLYLLENGRLAFFGGLDMAGAFFASLGMVCGENCNRAGMSSFFRVLMFQTSTWTPLAAFQPRPCTVWAARPMSSPRSRNGRSSTGAAMRLYPSPSPLA